MATEKGTAYGKMASIKNAPYGKREKRPALYVKAGEKASKKVPPKTHAKVSGAILPKEHEKHMIKHHKHMVKHMAHLDGMMEKIEHHKKKEHHKKHHSEK